MDSIPSTCRLGSGSSSSALLFLLPPCIILLAIDVALRRSPQPQEGSEERSSFAGPEPLSALSSRAQQVLSNFRDLERQFLSTQSRNRALSLELRRCKSLPTLVANDTSCRDASPPASPRSGSRRRSTQIRPEFKNFCDRLLESNCVWAQRKELKKLRGNLKASSEARCSTAFTSFCERLVLTNEVWKKRDEIKQLKEERDRMRRDRVGVVTRAAKQMVLDVQKERMIEEFVKDVMDESTEARKSLRVAHEQELREMASEWRKETLQLKEELGRLRLAQEARALEQVISNDLEDRLFEERLVRSAPPTTQVFDTRILEAVDREEDEEFGRDIDLDLEDPYSSDDDADTYLEEMSTMSSSTYVGSPSPSPMKKPRARLSIPPPSAKAAAHRRRVESAGYVGFSFNPLFYGNREIVSPNSQKNLNEDSDMKLKGKEVNPQAAVSKKPRVGAGRPSLVKTAWKV